MGRPNDLNKGGCWNKFDQLLTNTNRADNKNKN